MALHHSSRIVTDGLVLFLDAANPKSYSGSGTTWTDLSGNGNNGTINSGEWVNGYLRNFENTSNFFYISVPDSTILNTTLSTTVGGWTIEEIIWTNSVTYPESDAGSVASGNAYSSGGTGFDWNHGIGNNQFQFGQSSNASGTYEDSTTINISPPYDSLNAWKHRTMIWNRTDNTVSLFINGVYQGGASTPNTAGTSIYDGEGISFGSLYGWKHYGRRSIIRIYNKVFTESEIFQNFTTTRGRYGI